jgi:hypothetical protein
MRVLCRRKPSVSSDHPGLGSSRCLVDIGSDQRAEMMSELSRSESMMIEAWRIGTCSPVACRDDSSCSLVKTGRNL